MRVGKGFYGEREPFDEAYVTLLSHGPESILPTPIGRWRAIARRGRRGGRLVGVDEEAVDRLVAVANETFGRIDAWVDDAAVTLFGRLEGTPPEAFRLWSERTSSAT